MKKIRVYWTVTEDHSADIEVDDDFDPDEVLADEVIAEEEDSRSYVCTSDRSITGWEEITDVTDE